MRSIIDQIVIRRRDAIRAAAASVLLLSYAPFSHAQTGKPITIIVPYTAGSGPDTIARALTEPLRERLNRVVVVENRVGASGNIGTYAVARAAPDGATLLLTANTIVLNVGLFKDPGYDPLTSFAPIIELATGHMALAAKPALPVGSVQELIALAKAKPGSINYASPGRGTPHHLAMELLMASTDIKMQHVPYSGLAQSVTDLVGGHVDTMFVGMHSIVPLAKKSKVKILGVGSPRRAAAEPQIPTIAEQGVTGFDVSVWFGMLAPAGTPPETVKQLNEALNEVLKRPEIVQVLAKQGLDLVGGSPDRLSRLLADDLKKWLKVIKAAGIQTE